MAKFKFDPNSTQNEGRWRLHDPDFFSDYFRTNKWNGVEEAGVSFVVGTDKRDHKQKPQAIRFDKSLWSEEEAGKFWEQYKDRFERTWKGWKVSIKGAFVYIKELGGTNGS